MVRRNGLTVSLFALMIAVAPIRSVLAQPASRPNRISSFQANVTQGNVSFLASGRFLIAAPKIQYLPAADGQFLLLADFPNLTYPYPAQSIKVNKASGTSERLGIGIINFGQFQSMPPIFRIAISASKLDALKQISFQASPGKLAINWLPQEAPLSAPERTNLDAVATGPAITKNSLPRQSADSLPPPAPDRSYSNVPKESLKLVFSTTQFDTTKPTTPALADENPSIVASDVGDADKDRPIILLDLKSNKMAAPVAQSQEALVKPAIAKIEIENPASTGGDTDSELAADKTRVRVSAGQKIQASAFRLHSPERYVIDFDNLPQLNEADIPSIQPGMPFKSIRVGSAQDKPRLVFDLKSSDCYVHSELADASKQLVLTFTNVGIAKAAPLPAGVQIIIDPGHGGSDPGAQRNGIQEKYLTLAIANCLRQRLNDRGIKAILTRSDDTFVSLEDRVKLTNSLVPNLFLSIHINSLPSDSDIQGIETYYQTGQSKFLADTVHDSLVNTLEVPDRYVRKARFYVINHTAVPAVLAEVGFISSKDEREKLNSSDYQNRIAKALEQGVILFLKRENELAEAGRRAVNVNSSLRQQNAPSAASSVHYDANKLADMTRRDSAAVKATE